MRSPWSVCAERRRPRTATLEVLQGDDGFHFYLERTPGYAGNVGELKLQMSIWASPCVISSWRPGNWIDRPLGAGRSRNDGARP
jgi:hypothetical protein